MNKTADTQALKKAQYSVALYQLALEIQMGFNLHSDTGTLIVKRLSEEYGLSMDKVYRDLEAKFNNHFTC